MEAFSLLKYWKAGTAASKVSVANTATPTVVTAINDDESFSDSSDGDDGPFFDLEFAAAADVDEAEEVELRQKVEKRETVILDEIAEEEVVQSLSFSPSDDLFFKGKILKIDGSDAPNTEQEEVLASKFHAPASLVKSAAKFRVFMLGLKRSKSESSSNNAGGKNNGSSGKNGKLLTVRLKMEDVRAPLLSLLTRAASSNSKLKNNNNNGGGEGEENGKREDETATVSEEFGESERRTKKELVQRYLKMVKLTGKSGEEAAELAAGGGKRGMSLKAVIAKKHLGKSKSAVVHSMPRNETTSSKKRDDSLLEQQDGIQSAILHCKRSFNSSSSSQDGEGTTSDE